MEWVAISYSRGSPHLGNQTCVSCIPCIGRQIFTAVPAAWEAPVCSICFLTKSMNMPEPKLFYVVISSLSCFPFEIVKAKIFFFSFLNFLVHFKKHIWLGDQYAAIWLLIIKLGIQIITLIILFIFSCFEWKMSLGKISPFLFYY